MKCEFHLQDPTSPHTVYLFEAIVAALSGATICEGMFAFASRAGVDSLVEDPVTRDYLRESTMSLLIGIDAVTDRRALERLQEFEREYDHLSVQVFRNPTNALFHPKIARFSYPDGRRSAIVGSGNLTPGGLQQNFEAFSVVRAVPGESLDVSSWDRFMAHHAVHIGAIDAAALERADRNVIRGRGGGGARERTHSRAEEESAVVHAEADGDAPNGGTDRFLVARVPKAGNRWTQVHFNREVIERFFHIQHGTSQRVYLVECQQDGSYGPQEVRPCVYSAANKNLKIEVASHGGEEYPEAGPPVAVFHELQVRSFSYMLLVPGDSGYRELFSLTRDLRKVGQGLPRVIASAEGVRGAWPNCPLL